MHQDLQHYIKKENIFAPTDKIIVAVSGGIDSVVLCYLLKILGIEFVMAHCNYHLRGEASNGDADFVEALAEELDVDCYIAEFETEKIAKEQGKSIQIIARELRYEWLEQQRQTLDYDYIATAHHTNDSIETAIYNFSKGSGIRGIRGLLPKNGKIIHPMLFTDKEAILAFAQQHEIEYREDASNASDKYSRNKIRHHVTPTLKKINPSLEKTARQTFDNLRDVETLYLWTVELIRKAVLTQKEELTLINIAKLHQYPAQTTLLYELLHPFGFNSSQVQQLLNDAPHTGTQFISATHRLIVDRSEYIIEPIQQKNNTDKFDIQVNDTSINLPNGRIQITVLDTPPKDLKTPSHITYLDMEKIKFPLRIRHWQAGDYFHPLGMKGKRKKLQDFFTDRKMSILEKEKVWILESQNKIAWIINHRLDERFKLHKNSSQVLKLEWIKH